MDQDRMKGSAANMGGKTKKTAGNLTGGSRLQLEGGMVQATCKAQNAVSGIKDAFKGRA
jgi:uncharacterized protein YjbJ (UPF0337 family)